jgi:error-prone DNA polymerase
LIAYASAYLKCHYPAAFTAAILNQQPMGFYHPATLVKDAQRHGQRFLPVDVERSKWACTIEARTGPALGPGSVVRADSIDRAVRLGFNYVRGFRKETAEAIVAARPFRSLDDLTARVPSMRKDELRMLASIGALRPLRQDHRRTALWNAERALRPAGALFDRLDVAPETSPLAPMNVFERTHADYHGTSLTIGCHPMSLYRAALNERRIVRAADLKQIPDGRWVRVAGCVICRQRPGTAKGFLFLSLEDETGVANAIVAPDLYETYRLPLTREPHLYLEGVLQNQQGAISVRARHVEPLVLESIKEVPRSHDFR